MLLQVRALENKPDAIDDLLPVLRKREFVMIAIRKLVEAAKVVAIGGDKVAQFTPCHSQILREDGHGPLSGACVRLGLRNVVIEQNYCFAIRLLGDLLLCDVGYRHSGGFLLRRRRVV